MHRNGVSVPRRVQRVLRDDEELGRTAVLVAINGAPHLSYVIKLNGLVHTTLAQSRPILAAAYEDVFIYL